MCAQMRHLAGDVFTYCTVNMCVYVWVYFNSVVNSHTIAYSGGIVFFLIISYEFMAKFSNKYERDKHFCYIYSYSYAAELI